MLGKEYRTVLGALDEASYGINIGLDEGTEPRYLFGSSEGSKDDKLDQGVSRLVSV